MDSSLEPYGLGAERSLPPAVPDTTQTATAPTFATLLAPVNRERFLTETYGKEALYVAGSPDRFAGILGWQQLDELLAETPIWDNRSVALAIDGRTLPPDEFCYWGKDRLGDRSRRLDLGRIAAHLQQGATLVVDFIDRMAPGVRAIAEVLESVLQAPVTASAFVSWHRRQGYPPHFDTQQVFALQIAGRKAWRLYRGRFPQPADLDGFRSDDVPAPEKQRMMGEVARRVEMTPGDLLYIPAGQFHEALALDEASLHLSFGVMRPIAHDFLESLMPALPQDPLFRSHLPHPDANTERSTYLEHLAERIAAILCDPGTARQLADFQKARAYDRWAGLTVADRRVVRRFRVRWQGARLNGRTISVAGNDPKPLSADAATLAAWALPRDLIDERALISAANVPGSRIGATVKELMAIGFLEMA